MIFHHTGSKDSYVTNKIIGGVRRATGGNVGFASTIDIFKLYGESTLSGYKGTCAIDGADPVDYSGTQAGCEAESGDTGVYSTNLIEVSRGLIQFDLAALKTELDTMIDATNDTSLKINLVLKDVQGTQVAPSNFTLKLFKIEESWDEGVGDNVVTFGDTHAVSWASRSLGNDWTTAGGHYNSTEIGSQTFSTGLEDLRMDITTWVKACWAGTHTNNGWLLKLDSEETDAASYFVKRFASRHTRNPFLRPRLECFWSEYHLDDRLGFDANTSNTLSVRNYSKGVATSFPTSSVPSLTLLSGSWSKSSISTALVSVSGNSQTGMYAATVTMDVINDSDYTDLATNLFATGSLNIEERWYDGTFLVHSGSFKLNNPQSNFSGTPKDYRFSILDLKSKYTAQDTPMIRIFVRDRNLANESVRIPIQLKSQIINKAYYQIRDTNSQQILIPFSDKASSSFQSVEATRISTDGEGMYFSFPVSVLPRGRTYTIDIAFYDRGKRRIFESNHAFKVE
jgi:hypothetical protein